MGKAEHDDDFQQYLKGTREKAEGIKEAQTVLKRLAHGIRKKLAKCTETLNGVYAAESNTGRMKPKLRAPRMLDIFTWTAMATLAAMACGWDGYEPITEETGYDLRLAADRERAWRYLNYADPDVVICAFPCKPWSRLQNSNQRTPEQRERLQALRQENLPLIRFVGKVRQWCRRHNRHFLTEQPWSAASRNLPEIVDAVKDCNEGFTNMCMHNLRCPETNYYIKKDTWLATTSAGALRSVCCPCDNTHRHKTIQGSVRVPGLPRRMRLSEFAGGYTEEFADSLVQRFEQDLPDHCVLPEASDPR